MQSYLNNNIESVYAGLSTDKKPMYDAENKQWLLQEDNGGGGSGTMDHTKLANRDKLDQHPMSAITGLEKALTNVSLSWNE